MPTATLNPAGAAVNTTGGVSLIAAQGAKQCIVLKKLTLNNATAAAVTFVCGWNATPFFSIEINAHDTKQFFFDLETSPPNNGLAILGASNTFAHAEYQVI